METKNSQNVFSVSITHNSKIKELSNGNKKLEIELCGAKRTSQLWVPPFLSYKLWKLSYELWKSLVQTASKMLVIWTSVKTFWLETQNLLIG